MSDIREVMKQALEALDCLEAPPTGAINHYELERRKNALRAALAQPDVPEGYVLVPVEPTQAMMDAMQSSGWLPGCYRAMLAAAPKGSTK